MPRQVAVLLFAALVSIAWPAAQLAYAQADQVPAGGTFGPAPGGSVPRTDAPLPPSLPITRLVPFVHEPTGLTGLGPANWRLFSGATAFQISSSPEAPDGFIGVLVPSDHPELAATVLPMAEPPADLQAAARAMFESLKANEADGPAPEVLDEQTEDDGSGTLLVSSTSLAQGSAHPIRVITYARTTITSAGLIIALAMVPADQFPSEALLVREMVDSVRLPAA